jgi:hypothetical protein
VGVPVTALRLLESIHGHLGVLAAIALLHPAILLRKGRPLSRGMKWSVGLTTLLVVAAFSLGLFIYGDYREIVKRPLLLAHYDVGMLFETKEHLAWGVLTLALGAGAAAFAAPREAIRLRQIAAVFYALSAALCLVTAGLGTYIAAVQSFPQ